MSQALQVFVLAAAIAGGVALILLFRLLWPVPSSPESPKLNRPVIDDVPPYQPPESMRDPEVADRFQIVTSGLRLPVEFLYHSPNGADEKRRVTVQVVRLRPSNGPVPHFYLEGYCHTRRAPRMFRLDRIAELDDLRTGEVIRGNVALIQWMGEAALGVPRQQG